MKPRTARPPLPWDELNAKQAFPKPRPEVHEPVDTRGLVLAKIHPLRDKAFLRWLSMQPCVIEGKTNQRTGIAHTCWSPGALRFGRFISDAMHCGKAFSGRLKRDDSAAIPGCRHCHREQEGNADQFDRDYGIDRFAIASELYARFKKETDRV